MSEVASGIAGGVLSLVGALLLYGGATRQQLTRRALRRGAFRRAGIAAMIGGLALLLRYAGPATAVFIAVTLAMLVWSVVPIVAVWWHRPREAAR